jgi:hypothetical protein
VEGLAFGKLMGISLAGPFISYFIPSTWRFFGSIFPTFWISESYFAEGMFYWIYFIIGLGLHLILLSLTMKVFINRSN